MTSLCRSNVLISTTRCSVGEPRSRSLRLIAFNKKGSGVDCLTVCSGPNTESTGLEMRSGRRRSALRTLGGIASVFLSTKLLDPLEAKADLLDLLNPAAPGDPPRSYTSLCKDLVRDLKASVSADAAGADELKVRSKADLAKDKIKAFITTWKNNPEVDSLDSYEAISDAILALGQFYQKNGPRKKLTQDVVDRVLNDLDIAEKSLAKYS